jgi:dolichyl-phosphate beta-glucosyltransferase
MGAQPASGWQQQLPPNQYYNRGLVSLSIVIPAYNEEQRLPETLDRVLSFLRRRAWTFVEVIVVDDGSKDGTAVVVERYHGKDAAIRLLSNPGNRGKGYSVRHGMLEARGEWVLFSDADLSSPIEEFDKLLDAAQKQNAQIAFGSRALDRSLLTKSQPFFREASGRFFNLIMRVLTGLPFHDTQCGFKLYRNTAAREVFRRQLLNGFSFDVEDLVIAGKLGFKAVEVPVRWANVEGTKVGMSAGLKAFSDLLTIRLNALKGKYR